MNRLEEGGLEIEFTDAQRALKFDQNDAAHADFHDLQNMPRVDFIIELPEAIFFVELKDPGRPDAVDTGGSRLLKKVENGTLEASLIEKYLFSFFFRWAENKLDKSVHYLCLITLESPMLQQIEEKLEKQLKQLSEKSSRWVRLPLISCQVHNIETWTKVFPNWPVKRLAAAALPADAQ
jgi:hypothetical protein